MIAITITKSTFKDGFKTFAKKSGKKPSEIQILITTRNNETCEPVYFLYYNGKPSNYNGTSSVITMLDMIDADFDMLERDDRAAAALPGILHSIAQKHGVQPTQVTIAVQTHDDKKIVPVPYLNLPGQPPVELDWEKDIFELIM